MSRVRVPSPAPNCPPITISMTRWIDDISLATAADIASIITDRWQEGAGLEFKERLPGNSEGERKEFLADVSAFANSAGGVIVYGITDAKDTLGKPTGMAGSIAGINVPNIEAETRRLEQM